MTYNYDALYASTPNALGAPTQVFVDFFANLETDPLRVLDIGCGQGRDALFIGRLGHRVVGVDLSTSGIHDLNRASESENLAIKGVTADITTFIPEGMFDVLLIDRTLHMLPAQSRHDCLARLLNHVVAPGWVLIADEPSNISGLKRVLLDHPEAWDVTFQNKGNLFLRRLPK